MDIFISNLHENRARLVQQVPRNRQPVPDVGEVAVNPVPPGVTEGFDLLGLPGDVLGAAVLDVAAGGGPLEIAIELDAVGWVEIDALYLTPQALAFGEAGHDLEGIAQDHSVGPILVVGVKFGLVGPLGDAVEVAKKVSLEIDFLGLRGLRLAQEVVD